MKTCDDPAVAMNSENATSGDECRRRWPHLLTFIIGIMPFWRAFAYGTIHIDDASYVTENPMIQSGLSLSAVRDAVFGFHQMNWHPLVWMTYMAEIELFGLNLRVMHATNILLHAASSVLLYSWLSGTVFGWKRSLIAALLFAIHPQHVESVVWLTERKDVLSTLFLLLTIRFYGSYVKSGRYTSYVLSLVAFALGLTAKGMLVTLPVLLLALDYWPFQRIQLSMGRRKGTSIQLLREKLPFFVLSTLVGLLTILAQRGTIAGLKGLPLSDRLENSFVSLVRYLFDYFIPITFSASYPFPKDGWAAGQVGASVLLLAAISVIAFRFRESKPVLLVGWVWFIVSLLPVLGLVQVGIQAMADRYMYVPSIGLCLIASGLIPQRWITWENAAMPKRMACIACGILITVILGLQTDNIVSKWKDSITLFTHAVSVEPENNYLAHRALGAAFFDVGKLDKSAEHYMQALKCLPERKENVFGSVNQLLAEGHLSRASVYAKAALQLDENDADLWFLMGNVMLRQERTKDAEQCFSKAIELRSGFSEALHNLGLVICRRDNSEGMRYLRGAVDADPKNSVAWNSLGNAYVRAGDFSSAEQAYLRAIELADLRESKENLAQIRKLIRDGRQGIE